MNYKTICEFCHFRKLHIRVIIRTTFSFPIKNLLVSEINLKQCLNMFKELAQKNFKSDCEVSAKNTNFTSWMNARLTHELSKVKIIS